MSIEDILRNTLKTALLHLPTYLLVLYLLHITYADAFTSFVFGSLVLLLFTSRLGITYFTEYVVKRKITGKKTAIIGYNSTGKKLANYIEKESSQVFAGFLDHHVSCVKITAHGDMIQEHNIDACIDFAIENNIQELYSTILPEHQPAVINLVNAADQRCIRVKFVASHESATDYLLDTENNYGGLRIISLRNEPLQTLENKFKKRAFDLFVSTIVIVGILSWLFPLIAILIRLDSKGPIFFRQQRTGKDNLPFWCFKFRSMRVNKDSDSLQAFKGDSRVTRVGAILRKTSIDEFPQFFNVFFGNMSIVGPRPHMLKHTEEYSAIINRYMVRQFVKPGITGWAQINGYRGETRDVKQMEARVEHDIWYMENWSLMLDIKIMFMTIINVIKGEENAH